VGAVQVSSKTCDRRSLARIKNYGGSAVTQAVEVQSPTPDINELLVSTVDVE
jgi:hypothetical protein